MQFPPAGYEICLWVISGTGYEPAEGQNRGIRAFSGVEKLFQRSSSSSGLPFANLFPRISTWIFWSNFLRTFPRFGSISMEIDRIRMQFLVKNSMTSTLVRLSLEELFSYIFTSILFYMYSFWDSYVTFY